MLRTLIEDGAVKAITKPLLQRCTSTMHNAKQLLLHPSPRPHPVDAVSGTSHSKRAGLIDRQDGFAGMCAPRAVRSVGRGGLVRTIGGEETGEEDRCAQYREGFEKQRIY